MTDTTPLPCPFCNGEAIIIHGDRVWIECADCPSKADVGPFDTRAEALTAWNTRANADARLVEALRDCVAVLTDPIVGTIYHDDPDWYQALDRAVAKARAALSEVSQ